MSQEFEVRLSALGPNRVRVLALIRPLMGLPPATCRALAEAGDLIVSRDLSCDAAIGLATQLESLGSTVTIAVCGGRCCHGPDHFGDTDADAAARF